MKNLIFVYFNIKKIIIKKKKKITNIYIHEL